jgi:hypothetical protein
MRGIITIGQPHPFLLVGYFGAPPKCRVLFMPSTNSISAKQMCFQCLRKIQGLLRIGPMLAHSVAEMVPGKRSASYMNNSVKVTEVRIWL